ncbi:MAG: hypothetical protein ABJK11_09985 [Balneola sp.]
MKIRVTYEVTDKITVQLTNYGLYKYSKSFPKAGRLYIIENQATKRTYYIGTSQDIKERFNSRIRSMTEFGFSDNQLISISIYVIQVYSKIGRQLLKPAPPNDSGKSTVYRIRLDVEKLLIVTATKFFGQNVRNANKFDSFKNPYDQELVWEFNDTKGHLFSTHKWKLPGKGKFPDK